MRDDKTEEGEAVRAKFADLMCQNGVFNVPLDDEWLEYH